MNTEGMKNDPELGIKGKGIEHRSLQFQSLFGLDRHLHSAYYLGTALRAFQERNNGKKDETTNELAETWKNFSVGCSNLFDLNGLEEPSKIWEIDLDYDNEPSPFKDLAKILDEGTTKPESEPAKFIHDMRLLIIQTRTKVREILEKEKPTPKE